jgi:hypothetical protein
MMFVAPKHWYNNQTGIVRQLASSSVPSTGVGGGEKGYQFGG